MPFPDPSPSVLPPDPLVGRVLAERYRVDALLGRGGMGAVYRAFDLRLRRPVAIKVLTTRSPRPELVKRFEREAFAISRLDHPHCVHVLDFGTTADGICFLAMQFLEGVELRALFTQAFSPERAVAIMRQILLALEHAHRRGIVHRDLKPENVFVVRDDQGVEVVKLVDFGLAKLVGGSLEPLTRYGTVFGTPMYMSPEQAAGGTVDERADLYAVGVMLYEMLTSRPPFVDEDPLVVIRKQIFAAPPPLPEHVPIRLRQVITRLLEKTPAARLASAQDVRVAIERWSMPLATSWNTNEPTAIGPALPARAPASAMQEPPRVVASERPQTAVALEPPRVAGPVSVYAAPQIGAGSVYEGPQAVVVSAYEGPHAASWVMPAPPVPPAVVPRNDSWVMHTDEHRRPYRGGPSAGLDLSLETLDSSPWHTQPSTAASSSWIVLLSLVLAVVMAWGVVWVLRRDANVHATTDASPASTIGSSEPLSTDPAAPEPAVDPEEPPPSAATPISSLTPRVEPPRSHARAPRPEPATEPSTVEPEPPIESLPASPSENDDGETPDADFDELPPPEPEPEAEPEPEPERPRPAPDPPRTTPTPLPDVSTDDRPAVPRPERLLPSRRPRTPPTLHLTPQRRPTARDPRLPSG